MATQDNAASNPPDPFSPLSPAAAPAAAQPASEDTSEQLHPGSHQDQPTQQVVPPERALSGSADGTLQPSLDDGSAGRDASQESDLARSSLPPGPGPMQRLMTDDVIPESNAAQPSMEATQPAAYETSEVGFQPGTTLPSTQAFSGSAFQPDPELPPTLPTDEHAAEAGPAAAQKLNAAEMASGGQAGIEATANEEGRAASASSQRPLQPAAMSSREQTCAAHAGSAREDAATPDEGRTEAAGAGVQPEAAKALPQGGLAAASQPDAEDPEEAGGAGAKPAAAKGNPAAASAAPAKPRSAARRVCCLSPCHLALSVIFKSAPSHLICPDLGSEQALLCQHLAAGSRLLFLGLLDHCLTW